MTPVCTGAGAAARPAVIRPDRAWPLHRVSVRVKGTR